MKDPLKRSPKAIVWHQSIRLPFAAIIPATECAVESWHNNTFIALATSKLACSSRCITSLWVHDCGLHCGA